MALLLVLLCLSVVLVVSAQIPDDFWEGSAQGQQAAARQAYEAAYVDTTNLVDFLRQTLAPNGSHTPLPRYNAANGRISSYPLFLILGAQKGGTTGLRLTLQNHPSLYLSLEGTAATDGQERQNSIGTCEIHFFDASRYFDTPLTNNGLNAPVLGAQNSLRGEALLAAAAEVFEAYSNFFAFNEVDLNRVHGRSALAVGNAPSQNCVNGHMSVLARRLAAESLMSGRHLFDCTASYLSTPFTPYFIRRLMPHVRMVVLVRDPFERYMSDLNMITCAHGVDSPEIRAFHAVGDVRGYLARFQGEYATYRRLCHGPDVSFEDLHRCLQVKKKFHPLLEGLYADNLDRFFGLFDRSQFLVIHSGELFTNYASVLQRITEFVGLQPFDWASLLETHNSKKNAGDEESRLHTCPEHYEAYKRMVEEMQATNDEAAIREFYREPNERLFRLLGEDFGWNEVVPAQIQTP